VTNSSVAEKTGLPDTRAVIGDRRLAIFRLARRLSEGTPAHDALHAFVELLVGTASDPGWSRKPGRPRSSWLRDVVKVTHLTAQRPGQRMMIVKGGERNGPPLTTRSDDDDKNIMHHVYKVFGNFANILGSRAVLKPIRHVSNATYRMYAYCTNPI